MTDPERLKNTSEAVADRMSEILGFFKPGAKITLLVRRPGEPEQDFCLTNDDLTEVTAMIARRLAAGAAIMEVVGHG